MVFKVVKGNIVDAKVDAIVLPANTKLKEGSGTSAAIFKEAGKRELTKECNKIGYCEVGSAVPTLGYKLNSNFILHAVVPKWIDGNHHEYELLCSAYASALQLADVMECKSIAFPLLAAGNNGFDLELALEIAFKSIEMYEAKNIEEVELVIFSNHISEIVKNKGVEVGILVRNLAVDAEEKEHQIAKKKLFNEAKEVAWIFLEEQIQNGIEYFKVPENRKKAVEEGKRIMGLIINKSIEKIDKADKNEK